MSEMILLPDRLRAIAQERPDALALRYRAHSQTYGELVEAIDHAGAAFHGAGLKPGDRVALCAGNSLDYIAVALGAAFSGLSFVPLPTRIQPVDCAQMIIDAECKAIVTDDATRSLTAEILTSCGPFEVTKKFALDFEEEGWTSWSDALAVTSESHRYQVTPQTEFNIIYTSGTTGVPKGIRHDHNYRAASSSGMAAYAALSNESISILPTSLYGNWGLFGVFSSLWGGGASIIYDRFGMEEFEALCRDEAPTHFFFVPAQIRKLVKDPAFGTARNGCEALKFSAGSPLSIDMKKEVIERWPGGLADVYGMTEGAPSAILFVEDHLDKIESVGSVFGMDAIVLAIDEEGQKLPTSQVGEIGGRNSMMTEGYLKKTEATKALFWYDEDGKKYIRSGDMGYVDDDGFLFITDRKKDLIITGGFNVFPIDLETVLMRHNDVEEATVIGIADDRWGETPVACIVRRPESTASIDEIREWTNERLGKVQRISKVFEVQALPRNHMGKVLKAEVKKAYTDQNFT